MFVDETEKSAKLWITSLRFAEDMQNLVNGGESASDVEEAALEENVEANDDTVESDDNIPEAGGESTVNVDNLTGRETDISLVFAADYQGFKDYLAFIRDYKDRMVIKNIDVNYDLSSQRVNANVIVAQYAILSAERELTSVETGVTDLGCDNIFVAKNDYISIDDYIKNLSGMMGTDGTSSLGTDDYFLKIGAVTDNTDAITIGQTGDIPGSTYVVSRSNSKEDVYFAFKGSNGEYSVEYRIGETINLRIISSDRFDANDRVEAGLHIDNATDSKVYVSVEGENSSQPRIDVIEKNGDIEISN